MVDRRIRSIFKSIRTKKYAQAFLQKDWQASFGQDKLYRIPLRSDVSVLYYRQDLLNQLGRTPPQSFVDIISTDRRLKDKGIKKLGYLWQGRLIAIDNQNIPLS